MKAATALALAVLVAFLAGAATAVVSVVLLALVDLYLAGHGLPGLTRPWLERGAIRLSRADVLLLAVSVLAGIAGWLDGASRLEAHLAAVSGGR